MSDTLHRRSMRFRFSARGPMTECHPPILLNKLAIVFDSADIRVTMSSEKYPKPMMYLAYPLPLNVEGLEEWADITLETGLNDPADIILARLNNCCPEGLEILDVEQIPHYASPVAELVETAHWKWFCPKNLFVDAVPKIRAFIESDSFLLTKTGKIDGKKSEKSIEVRHLVLEHCWDGNTLEFSTRIVQGQALNPIKLFVAILGTDVEHLGAFQRKRIDLMADPKLAKFDKFAHKLRNLYEDAVLLESGTNVKVYDDDDEVLSL